MIKHYHIKIRYKKDLLETDLWFLSFFIYPWKNSWFSYLNLWWMYGTCYRWIGNDVKWLKQEVYLHYIRSQTNKIGHFENIHKKFVFLTFWTLFFKKPSLKFTNFLFFLNQRICSFDCKQNYPLSIFLRIYPVLAQCV